MFTVNAKLALLTTLVVPATAMLASRYGTRMTHSFRTLFGRVGQFNVRIEENVGGMRVVQAFANEDHERQLFAEDNHRYRQTKLEAYRIMAASTSLSYLSMRLTQIIVMIAGTYFVLHGELSNGGFISFLLLIGVFFRPVEKINAVLETYPKGIAGFKRYTELLDTEPDIVDAPGAVAVAKLRGEIRYEGVTFGYSPAPSCCGTWTWPSAPGRPWPSSARPAPARRRCVRCCRASTTCLADGSPSMGSIYDR